MQQLHETVRDSERQPAIMRDIETHVATPWDQRDSESKPATMGEGERHEVTP